MSHGAFKIDAIWPAANLSVENKLGCTSKLLLTEPDLSQAASRPQLPAGAEATLDRS